MAKKTVVEITCDRCERTEYRGPDGVSNTPDLRVSIGFETKPVPEDELNTNAIPQPKEVVFPELCSSCQKTVKNLFDQMTKKINWRRSKGEGEENGG